MTGTILVVTPKETPGLAAEPDRRPNETRMTSSQDQSKSERGAKKAIAQAKRRGGGPKAVAQALPAVTKKILGKRGFAEGSLVNEWSSIVGKDIARRCIPKQLAFKRSSERREGTLTLRAESGFATELVYLEPQMLERINAHFGYRAVARLKILQGPVLDQGKKPKSMTKRLNKSDQETLNKKVAEIEDEDLRNALADLGAAVFGKPQK